MESTPIRNHALAPAEARRSRPRHLPLTLTIDASTALLQVGLSGTTLRNHQRETIELRRAVDGARESSQRLLPLIAEVVAEAEIEKPERIVVAAGPGSFTGIRVAVSSGRNLAQLWRLPIATIDTLRFYLAATEKSFGHGNPQADCESPRPMMLVMVDGKQSRFFARSSRGGPFAEQTVDLAALELFETVAQKMSASEGGHWQIFCNNPAAIPPQAIELATRYGLTIELLPTPDILALAECATKSDYLFWQLAQPNYLRDDPATAQKIKELKVK